MNFYKLVIEVQMFGLKCEQREKKRQKKSKNLADFLDSVLASKRWHHKNLPLFTFPLKMHTVDRPLTSLTAVKTENVNQFQHCWGS